MGLQDSPDCKAPLASQETKGLRDHKVLLACAVTLVTMAR